MKLISEINYSNIIFYDDIFVESNLYFVITSFLNELNGLMVIHDAKTGLPGWKLKPNNLTGK